MRAWAALAVMLTCACGGGDEDAITVITVDTTHLEPIEDQVSYADVDLDRATASPDGHE